MHLFRILAITLLASMWSAPGMAQQPLGQPQPALPNLFNTHPSLGTQIPGLKFNAQSPNAKGKAGGLNPRTLKQLNPFVVHPNDLYALAAPRRPIRLAGPAIQMAQNDVRCYAIRDYQFSRVLASGMS